MTAPLSADPSSAEGGRRRTDRALLFLLVLLNLGSAATTVMGARQVLPSPLAEIVGLTIQVMLFLLLAGLTVREAVVRKWLVVGVLAMASIYTSFFAYYEQLAGHAVQAAGLDRAHQAHAAFVSSVYQPTLSRAGRLEQEAAALWSLAEEEGSTGLTTGQKGYGPVARGYAAQARDLEVEGSRLRADLERLGAGFAYPLDGLSAETVYQQDLLAWQTAPDDWKAGVPAPGRDAYVDAEQQVDLLTPFYKVRHGELPAVVALMLASLVDGVAILLGTAIQGRGRPMVETVSQGAARLVTRAKDGGAAVRAAWEQPGMAMPPPPAPRRPLQVVEPDPVQVVPLRIDGRPADFLTAFYDAIHPETGELAFLRLQAHDNGSFRIAARILADRLRRPGLGWLVVRDGWWCVPPGHYTNVTSWLGEEIRKALAEERGGPPREAGMPGLGEERVLELNLPLAA